jgi:hypothetical protein
VNASLTLLFKPVSPATPFPGITMHHHRRSSVLLITALAALALSPSMTAADTAPTTSPAANAATQTSIIEPLIGTWAITGMVDLDDDKLITKPLPKEAEAINIRITANALVMSSGDKKEGDKKEGYKIEFKALDHKADGIHAELKDRNGHQQKGRFIILADGLLVDFDGASQCPKLCRTDGKPVGLTPSVLPKPSVADTAPTSAPLASRFTVVLNGFSTSQNINFQDGDLTNASFNSDASLNLRVKWQKPIVCLGQDDAIVWQELTSSSGESLIPAPDERRRRNYRNRDYNNNRRETWAQAQLKAPTKPVDRITRMKGTIPMRCELKPGAMVEFKPIKDWIGKSQKLSDTCTLTLIACSDKTIKYRTQRDADEIIREVQLVDADGTKLEDRGRGSNNNTVSREYADPIPLDGALRIRLVGETTVVQVPFEFTNVPLREPQSTETSAPNF